MREIGNGPQFTWQIYVMSAGAKGKRNRKFIYIIFVLSIGILCAWLGIILLINEGEKETVTWLAVWIISLSRIQLYNELNLFCETRRIIVELNYVCGDSHLPLPVWLFVVGCLLYQGLLLLFSAVSLWKDMLRRLLIVFCLS